MKICVIGDGAWGTALAINAVQNKHEVVLWGAFPEYLEQMQSMCEKLYAANLNIDYYPTNFVVQEGILYYIDYECNQYMQQWDFEHWGCKYWSKTQEFVDAFMK